ncbi:MAG TPA: transcriptional regulator [Chthonomonadaceae bacterium]|nr:transcriptional regulator [Chthonomonadaceae bacterium]
MEVHPIRTEKDHQAALEEIDRLWNAPPGSPEEDRLDVLVTLVDAYEAQHRPILPPDPIEALRYYMESRGITRRDLEEAIGYRGRVAEVLNRKRPLDLKHDSSPACPAGLSRRCAHSALSARKESRRLKWVKQ